MEVKVSVKGIPRVVCGVTEETTCQDVVLVLAQSLGQPGRYTLREKFKDFERCMTPDERLLETLKKYGEQAKEVQLSLQHSGLSAWDEMGKVKVGRYQPYERTGYRCRIPDEADLKKIGMATATQSVVKRT
uniref:Ras-associating domain-containing protein n=1 Tax=Xiphophorus couchianus TaxID=32473 RepID=A0A3B5KNJ0_9TELE